MKTIKIKNKKVAACSLKLGKKNLVLAVTKKGFIGCGYIDLKVAEKFSDTACRVRGVSTIGDLLRAEIVGATTKARARGIAVGMIAREVIEKYL